MDTLRGYRKPVLHGEIPADRLVRGWLRVLASRHFVRKLIPDAYHNAFE